MATYCVFDLTGQMERIESVGGPPKPRARDHFGPHVPGAGRLGIYESQEMLPASKLGIVCGVSRLISEDAFQVDPLEKIEAMAAQVATANAESAFVQKTGGVLVLKAAIKAMGKHARPQMRKALEDLEEERTRLLGIVAGEIPPEFRIDENLVNVAGAVFKVRLDPLEIPAPKEPDSR